MRPKEIEVLRELNQKLRSIQRLKKDLTLFPELIEKLDSIDATMQSIQDQIYQLMMRTTQIESQREMPLTEDEIDRLLQFNRHLRTITRLINDTTTDLTPHLEAKIADPNDPMMDYEIQGLVDFVLHENDPAYSDDSDNFLTRREHPLKRSDPDDVLKEDQDILYFGSEELRREPQCWMFQDLDINYGLEKPSLSFRDCSRIGRIYIDIQVWQQYCFDVTKGTWGPV